MNTTKTSLFYIVLCLLPKNLISTLMGRLVSIRLPKAVSLLVNKTFARVFRIDLSEAEKPIEEYPCLQEFFIRRLKPGLRMVPMEKNVVVSPCDGTLSVAGPIADGQLIQAKGKLYSVRDLLDDDKLAARFADGLYATIYLSPRDYHRFHVPMDGEINDTIYIPGTLWPVNDWAVKNISNLFCQNERIVSLITDEANKHLLAHVAVGATMVGKIDLDYFHFSNKKNGQKQRIKHAGGQPIKVKKGQELGKFMFGSTIVLLFEKGLIEGFRKEAPTYVKMGEVLGNFA